MLRTTEQERANYEEMPAAFHAAVDCAWRLINLANEILERATKANPPKVSDFLRMVLISIAADAAAKFRMVVAASELGQFETATIISRSILDSLFNEQFILRGRRGRVEKKPARARAGWHASDSRALLFQMATAIKTERQFEDISQLKGAKRLVPKSLREEARANARAARKKIGKKWAEKIAKKKAFSGLTTKDLAIACGRLREYVGLWCAQSNAVHGGEAVRRIGFDGEQMKIVHFAAPDAVMNGLAGAAAVLANVLIDLDNAVGLGLGRQVKAVGLEIHEHFVEVASASKNEYGKIYKRRKKQKSGS
jgi:hypothetical protein